MKKILARHKWLVHCTINEMIDTKTDKRYFVAKIHGWGGWYLSNDKTQNIIDEVKLIREKIENDDKKIFLNPKYFKNNIYKEVGVI